MKTNKQALLLSCILLLCSLATVFNAVAQRYVRDVSFANNQPTADGLTEYTIVLQHQPDASNNGKLLAVGDFESYQGTNLHNATIVRLNANGTRDGSFTPPDILTSGTILEVEELPDGKILLGGTFTQITQGGVTYSRGGIARLNPDGTLDTDFDLGGGIGLRNTTAPFSQPNVWSILVKDNTNPADAGNILVGGEFDQFNGSTVSFLIELSGVDGSLVRDWGVGPSSWNTTTLADGAGVYGMAFVPAGSPNDAGDVYVAGEFGQANGQIAIRIARMNRDGTRDAGFNTSATPSSYRPSGGVWEVVVGSDGLPIIGGLFPAYQQMNSSWAFNDVANSQPRIAKLNRDGSLVNAFSGGFESAVRALVLEGDYLYVGGSFSTYAGSNTYTTSSGSTSTCNRLVRLVRTSPTDPFTLDVNFDIGSGFNNIVKDVALQRIPGFSPHDFILVSGTMTGFDAAAVSAQPQQNLIRLGNLITVLPSLITNFKKEQQYLDKVLLSWKALGSGIVHELQVSIDGGKNFSTITSYESSFAGQRFSHSVSLTTSSALYRIAIKKGNSYTYTEIVSVQNTSVATDRLWKVSDHEIGIRIANGQSKDVAVLIVSTSGQQLYKKELSGQAIREQQVVSVPIGLHNCYVVLVNSEGQKMYSSYLP